MQTLPRFIEESIQEALEIFPALALMGPRQTGKSTLIEHLLKKEYKYISFDDLSLRLQAKKDPALFLKNNSGKVILDEIQYVPELFSEIKLIADKKKEKGQFVLTGSQYFPLIKDMQESLAGRILILYLFPMTLQERLGLGRKKHWLVSLLNQNKIPQNAFVNKTENSPAVSLFRGGIPTLLEKPNKFVFPFFASYTKTYLERDLKDQFKVGDITSINRYLQLLAPLSSQEINKNQLGRELSVAGTTSKRWLDWLRASLIFYEDFSFSNNYLKRVSKHSKGYLFDSGFISYLLQISDPDHLANHPLVGNIFETCMRLELKATINAFLLPAEIYHFRSPYGLEVDIVIESRGKLYLFEVKWGSDVSDLQIYNLQKLQKELKSKVEFMGVLTPYGHFREIAKGIYQIPWILKA